MKLNDHVYSYVLVLSSWPHYQTDLNYQEWPVGHMVLPPCSYQMLSHFTFQEEKLLVEGKRRI